MLLDDTLTRWLARPRNLTDGRPLIPRAEQAAVAAVLGLDHRILDRADMAAQLQVARAHTLLTAAEPDVAEAVEAARTAQRLAPWRLDALDAVSEAHVRLYEHTGLPLDGQLAEQLTRQLIRADPACAAAFVRLNRIERVEPVAPPPSPDLRPMGVRGTNWAHVEFDHRWLWAALTGALLLAITLGVLLAHTAGVL